MTKPQQKEQELDSVQDECELLIAILNYCYERSGWHSVMLSESLEKLQGEIEGFLLAKLKERL